MTDPTESFRMHIVPHPSRVFRCSKKAPGRGVRTECVQAGGYHLNATDSDPNESTSAWPWYSGVRTWCV
jgi:hypothetical protein